MDRQAGTFVLIPGAWLGGWVWEPVTRRLRRLGHRVEPVTLSGLADGSDGVEVGLATHVDDVLSILEKEDRDAELRLIADNAGLWPPPTPAEVAEGDGLSPEDARRLGERFVPHPGRTVSEPAVLARPLAKQPATYIAAALGGHSESEEVVAMRDEPNWTFRTIDTGHWPMVSAPDELVQLLDEAVTP